MVYCLGIQEEVLQLMMIYYMHSEGWKSTEITKEKKLLGTKFMKTDKQ